MFMPGSLPAPHCLFQNHLLGDSITKFITPKSVVFVSPNSAEKSPNTIKWQVLSKMTFKTDQKNPPQDKPYFQQIKLLKEAKIIC